MDKNRVLLALTGEEEIKTFSGFLSGFGFDILSVTDGAHALELAIQETPSIIIADTALAVIKGERLFQILRNNPHTSRIPFLFISDSVADIKGFRTGVDIFLLRPVNLEETYSRIRQTLSARSAPLGTKEIEGRLAHMSLADLLQFLHLNRKEGELRLTAGEKQGGIFIKDGNIHNAVLDGVEREKALFRLLQWPDGKFEFIPKTVSTAKKIRSTTGNLLMEGMRQIDEFKKKEDQFPGKKTVLKAKIEVAALPKGLQPIIYEILQAVKDHSKVEDVIERCPYPDYEVYKTLSGMIAKGVLEEEKTGEDTAAREEFLTTDQMISIREKIMSRFADMTGLNYGKITIISTSGGLVADLLQECRKIPGFTINTRSAFSELAMVNPMGEVASFKLYGGMDLVLFSIPSAKDMGPVWRAFSASLVGLILIWDEETIDGIKDLAAAKKDILLHRRVPVVHVYKGRSADESAFRKALNLKLDEHLFRIDSGEKDTVFEVFYSLFGNLIKEGHAAV